MIKRSGRFIFSILVLLMLSAGILSCSVNLNDKATIIYVNSYHRGHPSSDDMMDGVIEGFSSDSFKIVHYFMDTKRNTSRDFIEKRAAELNDSIRLLDPDILIVSDDNAVKYLVKPYMLGQGVPIVFCGVNMSAAHYELPEDEVTGMIEILPVADLLTIMKSYYPDMKKILVLNENTTTSRKEATMLDTLFQRFALEAKYTLADDFETWQTAFKEANDEFDIIYIVTHAAIRGWDHQEAVDLVHQHIRVPVVTCEDFMMPYAVFGLTKVAKEHGIWAAQTAHQILQGTGPKDIPSINNQMSETWINEVLANKIGFKPDSALLPKLRRR